MSRHVLILGATSDIVQALAYEFAGHGYSLTLAARQPSRLVALVSDLQIRHNVAAKAVAFEALDFAGHAAFYDRLDPKPDGAICVFGYLGRQEVGQVDFTEAARIIQTNYTGAVSILNVMYDFTGTIDGYAAAGGQGDF